MRIKEQETRLILHEHGDDDDDDDDSAFDCCCCSPLALWVVATNLDADILIRVDLSFNDAFQLNCSSLSSSPFTI